MPSCEKCWSDAGWESYATGRDKVDVYRRLVSERTCTPEEQAGPDAWRCRSCKRDTVHQHAKVCMSCGADVAEPKEEPGDE